MPMPPRPIDATLHGITDYTVGTALVTVFPRLAGLDGTASGRQIRISGAIHAGYSTLTDYPLGLVKLIPYKVHLALDALGALGLAGAPFASGRWKGGVRCWAPHVGLAVFELTSLLMSDPSGRGDYHGDVEAIRRQNLEDPRRKIYEGEPAVVPGSARRDQDAAAA